MDRKMNKFVALTLFLLFIYCTSCNDGNSANNDDKVDSDSLSHADTDESDSVIDADDSSDEVLTESDEKPDDTPDTDNAECFPAHKDAGYPYYRNDGTIHFCRECDKPTKNDPDCIANLWVDGNKKLFAEHPDKDCLEYPCMMEDLTPIFSDDEEVQGLIFYVSCFNNRSCYSNI